MRKLTLTRTYSVTTEMNDEWILNTANKWRSANDLAPIDDLAEALDDVVAFIELEENNNGWSVGPFEVKKTSVHLEGK